ncbi:MAG: TolC family protein [Sandaracinaceae bacterium]|nr:TolC family protein [Sandaracinaceae bacterium]
MTRWVATLCLLGVTAPAIAQQRLPSPLELRRAMSIAVEQRPEVAAAAARARAAARRPAIVSVPDDPMVMGTIAHLPLEQIMGADWNVMVETSLPLGGVLGGRERAALAQARSSSIEQDRVELDVALGAATAFLDLYLARALVGLIEAQRGLAEQLRAASQARHASGLGSQAEVLRAEAEVARLGAERAALDGRVQGAEAMLVASLGLRAGTRVPALGVLDDSEPLAAARALTWARRARPELGVMRAEIDRWRGETDAMEGMYWPMLTVRLGGAYSMAEGAGVMGSLGLSIPIFRDRLDSGVAEARAMREMAEADLDAMERMIEGQVGEALGTLSAARARRDALHTDVVPRAEQAVDASLAQYGAGRVPQVMVIEALRMSFEVRTMALMADVEAAMAQARLQRVLGSAAP